MSPPTLKKAAKTIIPKQYHQFVRNLKYRLWDTSLRSYSQQGEDIILRWLFDGVEKGFYVDSFDGNGFRDRWGVIHARYLHPACYDAERMQPSRLGVDYLLPIFTNAVGHADVEALRQQAFDAGSLFRPYHSVNTDVNKRIRYLGPLD